MDHRTFCAIVPFILACQGTPAEQNADMPMTNPAIAVRPYEHKVPASYDGRQPVPLVLVLHGLGASGVVQDAYFGMSRLGEQAGFLTAYPDGKVDNIGQRFWNATDTCCDIFNTKVDDVAYLGAVIDDMQAHYKIDPKRIYLVGHSNGGFMAYRLACDLSPRIAAIASLAGANWKDPTRCQPTDSVAALQIHGDKDTNVAINGTARIPSALESVAFWAQKNGCAATPDRSRPPVDLDRSVAGAETAIARFTGCQRGAAELWTLEGSGHIPVPQPGFARAIYDFLSAHPKP